MLTMTNREAKIMYVACELAGDVFCKEKLPGHGADWINRYWEVYGDLAARIVDKIARIDGELGEKK